MARHWLGTVLLAPMLAISGCQSPDINYIFDSGPDPLACLSSIVLPDQIDLEDVPPGESRTMDLAISNPTSCSLAIDWIRLQGDDTLTLVIGDSEYRGNPLLHRYEFDPPMEFAPGESATWTVRFTPRDTQPAGALLSVHARETAEMDGLFYVGIAANATGPRISVEPDPIDFGAIPLGRTAAIDVILRSIGTREVRITGIDLKDEAPVGVFGADFDFLPAQSAPNKTAPLGIPNGESAVIRIHYTPEFPVSLDSDGNPIKDSATLEIVSDTLAGTHRIPIRGFGFEPDCPQPVLVVQEGEEVAIQTTLHLIGDQSQSAMGIITQYKWSVDQPTDNPFTFVPSNSNPNPTHEVRAPGSYRYCLDVCDSEGCSDDDHCRTTSCKTVRVFPQDAIVCELTWTTPGDPDEFDEGPNAGSDMDLHFTHPFAQGLDIDGNGTPDRWFDMHYDCFWLNPNPDWEILDPDTNDNPSLNRDDIDGAGPETIILSKPVDGRVYRLGVHYKDDRGFGASYPRVKCWIQGELVFDQDLADMGIKMSDKDFWEVLTINWPQGLASPITNPDGTRRIVKNVDMFGM